MLLSLFDHINHCRDPRDGKLEEPKHQHYEAMARSVGTALRANISAYHGIADWLLRRYIGPYSRDCNRDRLRLFAFLGNHQVESDFDSSKALALLQTRVKRRLRAFQNMYTRVQHPLTSSGSSHATDDDTRYHQRYEDFIGFSKVLLEDIDEERKSLESSVQRTLTLLQIEESRASMRQNGELLSSLRCLRNRITSPLSHRFPTFLTNFIRSSSKANNIGLHLHSFFHHYWYFRNELARIFVQSPHFDNLWHYIWYYHWHSASSCPVSNFGCILERMLCGKFVDHAIHPKVAIVVLRGPAVDISLWYS